MIRDVVLHLHNEQPLLADLYALPTAADACLVCTNLRTMNGQRPVFVDRVDSRFLFPLGHVRFVEIPVAAGSGAPALPQPASGESKASAPALEPPDRTADAEAELPSAPPEDETELEIDEAFLRRVRDI